MTDAVDVNPPYLHPSYWRSAHRAPKRPTVELPREWFHDLPGPAYGHIPIGPHDHDLTRQHDGSPMGQKISLSGQVRDSDGRAVPNLLVEIWQANSAGRYADTASREREPLDPNFTGAGRVMTDTNGHYRFVTIKPGAYAGRAGTTYRAAHIHVSLFGRSLSDRLVTQCYFEGDPLMRVDLAVAAIPDPRGVDRLIARWDPATTDVTDDDSVLGYRWDIVLRGRTATPMEG